MPRLVVALSLLLPFVLSQNAHAVYVKGGEILNFSFDESDFLYDRESSYTSFSLSLAIGSTEIFSEFDPETNSFKLIPDPMLEDKRLTLGESIHINFFEDINYSVPGLLESRDIVGSDDDYGLYLSNIFSPWVSLSNQDPLSMWKDLNGSFSLFVVGGNVGLSSVQLTIDDGFGRYNTMLDPVTVPLPGGLLFFLSGALIPLIRIKKKRAC